MAGLLSPEPTQPSGLPHTLTLHDGRRCQLRPIEPKDAARLQRFVRSLSDESAHQRFFASVHELSPAQLKRFTSDDDPHEFAIIALDCASGADPLIVGTARCLRADGDATEFAVTIADAWQGAGLGSILFDRLLNEARQRGIERIEGETLVDNDRMLKLARSRGFRVETDPSDPSARRLTLELGRQDPAGAITQTR